jgi:hypothetical protein
MKWNPHTQDGLDYDLSHLDPFEWVYQFSSTATRPDSHCNCQVNFSSHCFTRKQAAGENIAPDQIYQSPKESRVFCTDRFELSRGLSAIIRNLPNQHCFHTGHGKYFTVSVVNHQGASIEYDIFFNVTKAKRKGGWLNLIVQSAYSRDPNYYSSRPKARKIGFQVITYNALRGKVIKAPP